MIVAEKMRFFASHGLYEEERVLGAEYEVDVWVETGAGGVSNSDILADTVNYESIFLLVQYEMGRPCNLIETVCERIVSAIMATFPAAQSARARVSKLNPPIEANVARAFVEMGSKDKKIKVGLSGIKLFAFHGYYEEESLSGNWYETDVTVEYLPPAAAEADTLARTVNYESLFWIVHFEMSQPSKLIETVASRIFNNTKGQFANLSSITLRLGKLSPPVEGRLGKAYIELTQNYDKICARCKKPMVCYTDPVSCWCNELKVFPATQKMLSEAYKGCLCRECLGFFAR